MSLCAENKICNSGAFAKFINKVCVIEKIVVCNRVLL